MIVISENTASGHVLQESIAINGVPETFFDTVDRPEVVLVYALCTSHLDTAHDDFCYGA